jgi:thermitase
MRNLKFIFIGLFIPLFASAQNPAEVQERIPGQLIVHHRTNPSDPAAAVLFTSQGARVARRIPKLNVSVIHVAPGAEDAVAQSLRANSLISEVEYDHYARLAVTPNDPDYSSQWYLPQIQAPSAWNITTGSAIPIAVVDSGIDTTNPDLTAQVIGGWNFVTNSSDTADTLGHGTAVAGTLGAATNNGIGVAGVTWRNPILPVVAVDSTGEAAYSNLAAAIQYAADQGARVINVSVEGSSSSSVLQDAVTYAWNEGAVVVAAAGNNSSSAPGYPAACTNAIAVSATNQSDGLASFSDYGSWITLSAPGTYIETTNEGDNFGEWEGTSFAAPIVSGVAALVLAVNPSLTPQALVTLLEQNSDQVGGPGFSPYFGWGRVNAYRAVTAALGLAAPPPPVSVSISPGSASLTASQSVQFSATVANASNTAVNWSLNPAVGTLSSTGYYLAPSSISSTQTVTITAASVADSATTANATVTLNPSPSPSSPAFSSTPYYINSGGGSVRDASGITWAADTDFSGGITYSVTSPIANSTNPVYQDCRYGTFTYTFPVANGNYTVILKFAELYFNAAGQRQFNVALNGTQVLTNFDIFAQAGGEFLAMDRSFPVTVTNGQIQIQFTNGAANYPMVNGIEIDPASAASYLINAGGPAVTDASGISWSADAYFSGGAAYSTAASIANSSNPIYQDCRYGTFTYTFPVANGNYTVILKFAELYMIGPGQRQFNVALNGTQVLTNFDIFAQAGGEFLAIDRSFPVTVTNGQIQIQFTNGAANNPLVNGIEIDN